MRLLSKVETEGEILDTDKTDSFMALVTSAGTIQLKPKDAETIHLKPSTVSSYKLVRFHQNFLVAVENFKPSPSASKSLKESAIGDLQFGPAAEIEAKLEAFQCQTLPIAKNCTCIHLNSDHLAFGFADGSLLVLSFTNPSMAFLTRKEAHPFPVTGLAVDLTKIF